MYIYIYVLRKHVHSTQQRILHASFGEKQIRQCFIESQANHQNCLVSAELLLNETLLHLFWPDLFFSLQNNMLLLLYFTYLCLYFGRQPPRVLMSLNSKQINNQCARTSALICLFWRFESIHLFGLPKRVQDVKQIIIIYFMINMTFAV